MNDADGALVIDDQLALIPADAPRPPKTLFDRFIVPPFTILDRRQGYWADRRRAWLSLGIQSELGRGDNLAYGRFDNPDFQRSTREMPGTSIFDPVITELAYTWLCPRVGRTLDLFAGGSVRGIIAAALGRSYVGIDLGAEQVRSNRAQAAALFGPGGMTFDTPVIPPRWVVGDATDARTLVDGPFDLLFTCPPYGDLEVYSDDPRDLSRMPWHLFTAAYRWAIGQQVEMLRPDRFAAIVVGDIRDRRGRYRNLVGETVDAFEAAGADLYNAAVIVDPSVTAPVRARKQFDQSRKLVRVHQHFLVFVKGDPRAATAAVAA